MHGPKLRLTGHQCNQKLSVGDQSFKTGHRQATYLLSPQHLKFQCKRWSREGSLDNQPNAWFTPNHFVQVVWIADFQVGKDEPNKSTDLKQGTILVFFKLSPAKTTKPASLSSGKGKYSPGAGQENRSDEKRSVENEELNKGMAKKFKTAPKCKLSGRMNFRGYSQLLLP